MGRLLTLDEVPESWMPLPFYFGLYNIEVIEDDYELDY
jgi:hypothetical protein